MAQLKDTTVSGSLRATDTLYSTKIQASIFNIPTASNGTTYGPGTANYFIASNGTSVYWTNTAPRATGDKNGADITTTYLKLAGGTMTGVLTTKSNMYTDAYNSGALNLGNSNIDGVNSIYTADVSDNAAEGIHFYRDSTHVDSLHAKSGVLYFTPNRALGNAGTDYSVYHSGITTFNGNATTATEFNSNATVTLTGDTTGTSAGSKKSWSIATTTTKLSQTTTTALSSFTDTTALIYTAAGGSNTITDKPTSVDAFGCLSLKTADGWYGQLLISSNTATGLYWRTATSLSGGWKKLLDSTNYTDYTVKKDGTGASGSWGISITGNAATASKITNLTSTDNASSSDHWRKVWISYSDNATGRPAVTTNLVFQTSTNTLKSPHFHSEHISGGRNEFRVTYGSTVDMAMMIGSANENHGLYDSKADKWMIVADINGNVTVNGNAATASKLGTSNIGASDRPIYLSGGTATQTTYRMAATNVAATTALGIDTNLNTGIWYVNGTNSTNLYSQSDGVAYVNKYSDSWIHEIYGDYRTGQIAVRGKNNGTWQAWRKILDSSNYTNYMGNYVTLNTAQTISGTKTFTGGVSMKSSTTTNACNINYNSTLNALVFSFV